MFSPPLATSEEGEAGDASKIGKVMTRDEAVEEYAQMEKLLKIDAEQRYGIYAKARPSRVLAHQSASSAGGLEELEKCLAPAPGSDKRHRNLAMEHILYRSKSIPFGEQPYQLVMERALGDALHTLGDSNKPRQHTLHAARLHLHALKNLYEGLQHMHKHELCILDIKPQNIAVLGASPNAPTVYKFIDFGLAASFADLKDPEQGYWLGNVNFVYPLLANVWWTPVPKPVLLSGAQPGQPLGNATRSSTGGSSQSRVVASAAEKSSDNDDHPTGALEFDENPFRAWDKVSRMIRHLKSQMFWRVWGDFNQTERSVAEDNAAMQRTYGACTGADARLVVARASDVFALAHTTMFVYRAVSGVEFSEDADGNAVRHRVWGSRVPELERVTEAMGALLADMVHMRVKDDAILERYEAVLALIPPAPQALQAPPGAIIPGQHEVYVTPITARDAQVAAALASEDASTLLRTRGPQERGAGGALELLPALVHQNAAGDLRLIASAYSGDEAGVSRLLDEGADAAVRIADSGFTALMAAACAGHDAVVSTILSRLPKRGAAHAAAKRPRLELADAQPASVIMNAVSATGKSALVCAAMNGHAGVVSTLVQAGAETSIGDVGGHTALMYAAERGHLVVLELLLAAGAGVDALDTEGCTALMRAALSSAKGAVGAVRALHKAGAALDRTDDSHTTALMHAAHKGHDAAVSELLAAGAGTGFHNLDGWNALRYAAANGHTASVQALLSAAAIGVNDVDDGGWSALMYAAADGFTPVVSALLAAGADTSTAGHGQQWTALTLAALEGHAPVVAALLVAGVNVSTCNGDGATALLCAASSGHEPVVQLLLAAGSDVDLPNKEGRTPLMCASYDGHTRVVSQLLQASARFDTIDSLGWTALMIAADRGHTAIVAQLLETGADVDYRGGGGITALILAAELGCIHTVTLLLTAGARVDQASDVQRTALMHAVSRGHEEVLKTLVAAGADVDRVDVDGLSARDLAEKGGHLDVMSDSLQRAYPAMDTTL